MSEMTATRMTWLVRGATLAALAAAWSVAAFFLWDSSTVPDLRLPRLDPAAYFQDRVLDHAEDYERFKRWNWVLSTIVLLATFVWYALRGERFARESAAGRIGTGMLLGMLGFALLWLAQLPFRLASFWWDRRYDVADGS